MRCIRRVYFPAIVLFVLCMAGVVPAVAATIHYEYDNLHRLTKAQYGNWVTYFYNYDALGNCYSMQVTGVATNTITASAGAHGAISPAGVVTVNYGDSQTFNITPEAHYHVADVLVDGVSVGAKTSYTFTNVTAAHTIVASFAIDTHTITASAGTNGTISPPGTTTVNYGANQTFNFTPATGYHVASVTVDGTALTTTPLPTSYTFSNVTTDHTIAVTFAIGDVYKITAIAGTGGSITPAGSVHVNYGAGQTFTIKPDTNYVIKSVLVDGVSVGPVSSYPFTNVTSDHTITASFAATSVSILTDKDKVMVPPGKTAPLQVKLSDQPQANVVVTVAWLSGSPALSISGMATLTFTPTNWNTYQTVQIAATPDKNDMKATAVFQLSAPGQTGKQVTAMKGQAGGGNAILILLLD